MALSELRAPHCLTDPSPPSPNQSSRGNLRRTTLPSLPVCSPHPLALPCGSLGLGSAASTTALPSGSSSRVRSPVPDYIENHLESLSKTRAPVPVSASNSKTALEPPIGTALFNTVPTDVLLMRTHDFVLRRQLRGIHGSLLFSRHTF